MAERAEARDGHVAENRLLPCHGALLVAEACGKGQRKQVHRGKCPGAKPGSACAKLVSRQEAVGACSQAMRLVYHRRIQTEIRADDTVKLKS